MFYADIFIQDIGRPSSAEGTGLKGVFKYFKVAINEAFILWNSLRIIEKYIMI